VLGLLLLVSLGFAGVDSYLLPELLALKNDLRLAWDRYSVIRTLRKLLD
jgi:hypothetical protein